MSKNSLSSYKIKQQTAAASPAKVWEVGTLGTWAGNAEMGTLELGKRASDVYLHTGVAYALVYFIPKKVGHGETKIDS